MDLQQLRKKIDRVDRELLKLLSERMELAIQTPRFKNQVQDTRREAEVLKGIHGQATGLIDPSWIEGMYTQVIEESKRLQKTPRTLIGFQGEHGAYSEMAVRIADPQAVAVPCQDFAEVFDGVVSGRLDLGVVPIENSLGGAVAEVNGLLLQSPLQIVGEIRLPIHHCLMAPPNTAYQEIRAVYSHPQALSQCRGFLARNKLEPRSHYDTAGAARMVAIERPGGSAVIASALCAERYGLEILKEGVEDDPSNTTRFLVISRTGKEKGMEGEKGAKCAVAFSLPKDKAGGLLEALALFSKESLNLTRLESIPIPKEPGKFAFMLEFEGSATDPKVRKVLDMLQKQSGMYKFLGCFPEVKA